MRFFDKKNNITSISSWDQNVQNQRWRIRTDSSCDRSYRDKCSLFVGDAKPSQTKTDSYIEGWRDIRRHIVPSLEQKSVFSRSVLYENMLKVSCVHILYTESVLRNPFMVGDQTSAQSINRADILHHLHPLVYRGNNNVHCFEYIVQTQDW